MAVKVTSRYWNNPSGKRKPGRPNFSTPRFCKRCGQPLVVRPYRVRDGGGNYCKKCFNQLFRPPMRISGGVRVKAGGPVCPHCHTFRQVYVDGDDVICWRCSCRITRP